MSLRYPEFECLPQRSARREIPTGRAPYCEGGPPKETATVDFEIFGLGLDPERRLSKMAILVYLALRFFADSDGRAWPSINRIGEIVGVTRRHVIYAVKELSTHGVIEIVDRFDDNGRQLTNEYRFRQKSAAREWGVG